MKFKMSMLLLIGFLFATIAAPAHSPPTPVKTEMSYQPLKETANQMSPVMVQCTAASFDAQIPQTYGMESAEIAQATPAEKEVSVKPKDWCGNSPNKYLSKLTESKISLYQEKFNRLKNSK